MATTKTSKKTTSSNGHAQVRMTDEELAAYIGVAKDAEATQHGIYAAIRAAGTSVSGGRVREMFKAAHKTSKPQAARKAAPTK